MVVSRVVLSPGVVLTTSRSTVHLPDDVVLRTYMRKDRFAAGDLSGEVDSIGLCVSCGVDRSCGVSVLVSLSVSYLHGRKVVGVVDHRKVVVHRVQRLVVTTED